MLTASGTFPQETRLCLSRLSIMMFHIPPNASKDYLHNKIICFSLNKFMMMVIKIYQATDTADDTQRFAEGIALCSVIVLPWF